MLSGTYGRGPRNNAPGTPIAIVYFAKSTAIGPTSRYRIFQYLPTFRKQGVECLVHSLFDETYWKIIEIPSPFLRMAAKIVYVVGRFLRRVWEVLNIGNVDLVVIEGQLFPYLPALLERILVRFEYRIIVEIDDAIYLTPGHRRKIPALMGIASGVIVGNDVLAQYARKYVSKVYAVPTVVDTQRFIPREMGAKRAKTSVEMPLRVVWIGLACNLGYLDIVAPALKELQDKGLIKFRVICSRPPRWSGVAMEFRVWELEKEVELLQDCHIGIMPLPDTEWAKGKCGLKLLQYMSVGMATVASPVGVNREIISDGKTGYFAVTEQDWRDRLVRLCQDSVLREQMGHAARTVVEERYSLNVWGARLAKQYQEIVDEVRLVRTVDAKTQAIHRGH